MTLSLHNYACHPLAPTGLSLEGPLWDRWRLDRFEGTAAACPTPQTGLEALHRVTPISNSPLQPERDVPMLVDRPSRIPRNLPAVSIRVRNISAKSPMRWSIPSAKLSAASSN